jgi:hypothetical protein
VNKQFQSQSDSSDPRTFWGFMSCLAICATVGFVSFLYLTPRPNETRRLWLPVIIQTNGDELTLGESRQLEFWTPSAATRDYLETEKGQVVDIQKWQILSNDDPVTQFGLVLHSNRDIFGYRRVEEWGQGRSSYKPGWWWTMSVTTNFAPEDLVRIYRAYWKTPQAVRVEVIDSRGIEENQP